MSFLMVIVMNVPLAFRTHMGQEEREVFHTHDADDTALYAPKDSFF